MFVKRIVDIIKELNFFDRAKIKKCSADGLIYAFEKGHLPNILFNLNFGRRHGLKRDVTGTAKKIRKIPSEFSASKEDIERQLSLSVINPDRKLFLPLLHKTSMRDSNLDRDFVLKVLEKVKEKRA